MIDSRVLQYCRSTPKGVVFIARVRQRLIMPIFGFELTAFFNFIEDKYVNNHSLNSALPLEWLFAHLFSLCL